MSRTVLILCVLTAGCYDAVTNPSPANVNGTWQGPLPGDVFPRIRLTIFQEGLDLSGTWSALDFTPTDTSIPVGGPITGRVNRSTLSIVLMGNTPIPPTPSCRIDIAATVSDATMTGTYARFNCAGLAAGGSIALTKTP